jgi:hypothetical protein
VLLISGRWRGEEKMKRFVPKDLDPASRLGEILSQCIACTAASQDAV